MYERDLFALNEIAKQGKIKFINIEQKGDFAVAEATNGFCYMSIAEENRKRFNEGLFSFAGRNVFEWVGLPIGNEIQSSRGENIGNFQYAEDFNITIGQRGEFFCEFRRLDLLDYLRNYLSGWKSGDFNRYRLYFHFDGGLWKLRGYSPTKLFLKDFTAIGESNISDNTFRFCVNPHTLRTILKWFEKEYVALYFQNGNYEVNKAIFMPENNKLAVLMPIARKK